VFDFNAIQLLLISFFFTLTLLLFHNKYKNFWWSSLIINFFCFVGAYLIISSTWDWVLFFVGSILNLGFDTAEVYRKKWRYNTNNGYVYWAGPGWGLITVIVKQASESINLLGLLVLGIIVALIIATRNKSELQLENYKRSTWLVFALLALVIFPKLFLISFFVGIIFEYIAVTVLKSWSYSSPIFVLVGIGYGTLMVVIDVLMQVAHLHFDLLNIAFAFGIIVFLTAQYIQYFMKNNSISLLNLKRKKLA